MVLVPRRYGFVDVREQSSNFDLFCDTLKTLKFNQFASDHFNGFERAYRRNVLNELYLGLTGRLFRYCNGVKTIWRCQVRSSGII